MQYIIESVPALIRSVKNLKPEVGSAVPNLSACKIAIANIHNRQGSAAVGQAQRCGVFWYEDDAQRVLPSPSLAKPKLCQMPEFRIFLSAIR